MAYPRACGENPLNYEEYDPTPFSGGYDQVALYGRPKSPSAETCYPISEVSHHEGGGYGAETSPYRPGKSSCPDHGVDEDRPSFQQEDPPHGSDDFSYGRPKPKPSSYEDEGAGYGSGYGRPKPSAYEGGDGYGSGYGRPKPSGYEEEGGSYGSHKPSSYEEGGGYGSGYGRQKPAFEEGGQEFGSGYGEGEEGYGRPGTKPGYGGGGFGRPHRDEGYGRFEGEEGGFGEQRPSQFGGRFGESEEGGFGGGRRPGNEYGGEEGYGGRKKHSDYEGETGDRPGYFGDEPPAPPADEGYGGHQVLLVCSILFQIFHVVAVYPCIVTFLALVAL